MIPLCFTIALIQRADKFTDYFYVALGFQGEALVLGMIAIIAPRAALLGGAYVYGDLEVFHWRDRIQNWERSKKENVAIVDVDDKNYT